MKLNNFEFLLMNNPVRANIQANYEMPILRRMTSLQNPKHILEIGCGNGYGTTLIKKEFTPERITAIDLDEKMIAKALRRKLEGVTFKVMDASCLEFPDNEFDAVVNFGIIHHIPNWRRCLDEIKRVLRSGGEILFEDLSTDSFTTWSGLILKAFTDHPYDSMYSQDEFTRYLHQIGFTLREVKEFNWSRLIRFFVVSASLDSKG